MWRKARALSPALRALLPSRVRVRLARTFALLNLPRAAGVPAKLFVVAHAQLLQAARTAALTAQRTLLKLVAMLHKAQLKALKLAQLAVSLCAALAKLCRR